MSATGLAIEASGLVKQFREVTALDGFDLEVTSGSVHGLLGPNGAGKTTAVRVLTTLIRPDGGVARVAGHDVAAQPQAVRRRIGLAGQYAAVDEVLTGRQNLVLFGRPDTPGLAGSPKTGAMTLSVQRVGDGPRALAPLVHLVAHEFFHTWTASRFDALASGGARPSGTGQRPDLSPARNSAGDSIRMPCFSEARKCRRLSVTTTVAPVARAMSAMWAS